MTPTKRFVSVFRRAGPTPTAVGWLARWAGIGLGLLAAIAPAWGATNAAGAAMREAVGQEFKVLVRDRQQKPVVLLTGRGFRFGSGQIPLDTVRLDYLDSQGGTNITILSTNCVYDTARQIASSPDRLRIVSGDGRFETAGRGFIWWQSNYDLTISNEVRSTLRRGPAPAKPGGAPGNLDIAADTLQLRYQSNLVTYLGNVRAVTTNLTLTCRGLDIHGTTNRGLERVIARQDVIATTAQDGSEVRCEEAEYVDQDGRQQLRLTGNPRWQNGPRSGQAQMVLLDGTERTLRAYGDARFRVPRAELGHEQALGLGLPGLVARPTAADALVEIQAPMFVLQFPATNGPVQRIRAETNVVIVDAAADSTARARRLTYEREGSLELSDDVTWSSAGRVLRANLVSFDPLTRSLAARTNMFLRLPLAALTRDATAGGAAAGEGASNRFLAVHSDYLTVRDGTLHFGDQVRAELLEDEQPVGKLTCRSLGLPFASNRIQAIHATGGVNAEQFPTTLTNGTVVSREFQSDVLHVVLNEAGTLATVMAEGDVTVGERAQQPGKPAPVVRRGMCERLDAQFGASNRVDQAVAVGSVLASQDERTVTGGRATYDGVANTLTLTENPLALLPQGRFWQCEAFIWEIGTRRFRLVGPFKGVLTQLPGGTNLPAIPKFTK